MSGVTWRREMAGTTIAGIVVLGLLAIGGLGSGEAGSIVFGVLCGFGAGLLVYFRRPASITVSLTPLQGGTEIAVSGGPDAARAAEIVKTVAGPPPLAPSPPRPGTPGSLWSPPGH